jgi:DNA-binding response OmpR family regulator
VGGVADVVVLSWPGDRDEANRLASLRVPRLFLVDADADPPLAEDPLADWVRLPVEERDLRARLATLRQRAGDRVAPNPRVDQHGRLLYREHWVALSRAEERLARVLVARFGDVVPDHELVEAGWGDGTPNANVLRVHIHRLRRRVEPLGLGVRGLRQGGYALVDQRASAALGGA